MKNKILLASTITLALVSCSSLKNETTQKPETVQQKNTTGLKSINTAFMDKSVRPQDDFFQFADGRWVKENPVPASEARWGSFNELDQANKSKLNGLLTDAMNHSGKKGSQNQLLGDYYASYISMDIRNQKGITPIQAELDKIKNIKSRQEIVSIIAESHKVGVDMFFGFGVEQDLKNVTKHISTISQNGIGLPNCEYYIKPDKASILEAYKKYIISVLVLLKYDDATSTSMANSVIEFEKKTSKFYDETFRTKSS